MTSEFKITDRDDIEILALSTSATNNDTDNDSLTNYEEYIYNTA